MENQDTKILWDFNIRTDRVIETEHPDIVLIDKKNQEVFTITGPSIIQDIGEQASFWVDKHNA